MSSAKLMSMLVVTLGLLPDDSPQASKGGTPAASPVERICFSIEVFRRENCRQCDDAQTFLADLVKRRDNVRVTCHDVVEDAASLKRLHELCRKFGIKTAGVPAILMCNQFSVGYRDDQTTGRRIEELLTIEVFAREGCPHCASAKRFLADLERRYPGLPIRICDVFKDPAARKRMQELAERYHVQVPTLPLIVIYGRAIVGYQDAASTGRDIENLVKSATARCPAEEKPADARKESRLAPQAKPAPATRLPSRHPLTSLGLLEFHLPDATESTGLILAPHRWPVSSMAFAATPREKTPRAVEEPTSEPEAVSRPDESLPQEATETIESEARRLPPPEEINVPLFGKLRVSVLGMPAFTFLIGLLDGFNPCAMWVLIFLLSILVNLKSRGRLLLIAGTFVAVSGLAYFMFMAAWLNVFMLIGFARHAQIALGILAVFIGLVNVKDFFAFGRGFSFSIPQSAKPGIYARMRQIVMTKYITVALAGAVVLAVLVNTIELLCTAGLPALYTEILTFRNYPWWENYLYLSLYIVAYMFDDTIMLVIAVVTLSHRKLQEREGRWLKLISGLVILALGAAMLFKPDWLV